MRQSKQKLIDCEKMKWQDVCERRDLHNLPFKIELNEQGQVIMTLVKVYRSAYQGKLAALLYMMLGSDEVLTECAISTKKGTKVADVAWSSKERFVQIKHEVECSIAPEICVERLSESNTTDEINEKKFLYFENGAEEFWVCDKDRFIKFFNSSRHLHHSLLVPEFPEKI